jgi:TolB protein
MRSLVKPGRPSLASLALLLVLVACTQEPERELRSVDVDAPAESPTAGSPSNGIAEIDAPGRIAVLDEVGALVALDPDGANAVVLDESVEGQTFVRQPTWSPDGERIAWVRFDASGQGPNAVVTTAPDGTTPTETATGVAPFYLSWDPTSSRIAYLGPSENAEVELGVVELDDGGEGIALDTGRPLYLSWDPSGEQMLVHVGTDRLDRLDLDGTATPLGDRPGTFNVPVWTSDGASLVYASVRGDRQRLVAHDVEAGRADELVRFEGAITFVVSPDGRRVAFQVIGADQDEVGPLSVLDRETGGLVPIVTGVVPAFFWSPDGSKLLHLIPELAADRVWFHWGVWDGESSFTTPRFVPSDTFGSEYLQFFEQYAQSMSLWAPDGSAFTYAGSDESGASGVWIQPASEGAAPVLVADGVFAAWSPA